MLISHIHSDRAVEIGMERRRLGIDGGSRPAEGGISSIGSVLSGLWWRERVGIGSLGERRGRWWVAALFGTGTDMVQFESAKNDLRDFLFVL